MPQENVIVNIIARGIEQFTGQMGRAKAAVQGVGSEAKTTGGATGGMGKDLFQAAAAAGVVHKTYGGLKDSVNVSTDLAKETAGFARASGLSQKESQAWIVTAKQRGIQTKQLQMGMATYGRNLTNVGKDGEGASKALAALGINQKALMDMPMEQRLEHTANAFKAMPDGPEKAAAAQQLFGRSGQALLPILNSGAEGLRENLDAAKALVPYNENASKNALELAKRQRELGMATQGVKVAIGTALIPILTALVPIIVPLINSFAKLVSSSPLVAGAFAVIGTAMGGLFVAHRVTGMFKDLGLSMDMFKTKSAGIFAAITIGVAVFTALKKPLGVLPAAIIAVAVALGIMNAVLWQNPIVWVVVAIVALIGGLVALYKKCAWFRNAVNAVWGAIKTAALAAWGAIRPVIMFLWNNVLKPFGAWLIGAFKTAWTVISTAVTWLWQNILQPLASFLMGVFRVAWEVVKTAILILSIPILAVAFALVWLWNNVLKPVGAFLIGAFAAAWNFIRPIVNFMVGVFRAVGRAAQWVWQNVLQPLGSFLVGAFKAAWNSLQGPINTVKTVVNAVGNALKWVWDNVLKPVGEFVAGAFKQAWEALQGPLNTVKSIFEGIGKVLSKIKDAPGWLIKKITGGQHGLGMRRQGPFRGGLAMVGEVGPEFLQLPGMIGQSALIVGTGGPELWPLPAGSRVTPMPPPSGRITPLAEGTTPGVDFRGLFGGGSENIHVHVEVEGREIANAVAQRTADQRAAR